MKQMRVKFSGTEQGNEGEISRRKVSSQRSRSFKGENSRGQSWYRGHSSRELTYDYDSDHMERDEFRTAVAAAAFAIDSLEQGRIPSQQHDGSVSVTRRARTRERIISSSASNKMKNKEDDIVPVSAPSLLSKKSSELQEKVPRERPANSTANTELNDRSRSRETGGSFDKQSDKRTPESGLASSSSFPATEVNRKRSEPRLEDTKADVWEKAEMEKIKERHEKLIAKILEWENEKKAKAKKKLTRNKDESDKKRARALQSYKTDMEMIDQIAQAARTQAEENRRKEVIRVKEKADMIRLTGKIPTKTCLCF